MTRRDRQLWIAAGLLLAGATSGIVGLAGIDWRLAAIALSAGLLYVGHGQIRYALTLGRRD